MTKCPKCGANLTNNPEYCTNCSVQLYKICRGCGKKIFGNPKFCVHCGSMLR